MAFSPPEYFRLFAQKKAYQGGSRAPQDQKVIAFEIICVKKAIL